MLTKTCSRCGVTKPVTEFYAHPKTADGLLGKCKPCHRADVIANRNANLERYRAYDRQRGARMRPGYLREHRRTHPERTAAHNAVARALQAGILVKPEACWYCGSQRHVVAHHADYSLPLAVSWLCQACHRGVHRTTERLLEAAL
jgi:hypothetical protein